MLTNTLEKPINQTNNSKKVNVAIGGSNINQELESMVPLVDRSVGISHSEFTQRIKNLMSLLDENCIDAIYLDTSSNLTYFTGLKLVASERLHGAILTCHGDIAYICPAFEKEKTEAMISMAGPILTWEEHENPTQIVMKALSVLGIKRGCIAIDENTPLFLFDALLEANKGHKLVNGCSVTKKCRQIKSIVEISLIKASMEIALEVQKATARILYEGITTTEVQDFITEAHRRLGSHTPPAFNIVLFGEATAYPHGVPYVQKLSRGDTVLIDIGATVGGYYSDLTRTYVFGKPSKRQREIWELEQMAQNAVFRAAKLGVTCENLDFVAREVLESRGFGPGYKTPGLPHRTGHGLGLDIHEHPYIVRGNTEILQEGMCFSNEPMICLYREFGVRLEDHIYMTPDGPSWFTQPAKSIEDPFDDLT